MRIVTFMAHPDYAVLFFGGTTIKHTQRSDEVFVVSVSAGELGAASVHPNRGCQMSPGHGR